MKTQTNRGNSLPNERVVSFCTTCKGRLHHLRETLPQNLEDHRTDRNVEFVILNYNSKDGLDEWMRSFSDLIESGFIKYFRNQSPEIFHASHAKNQAFRLASGDILCNVDADNFTGPNFASYIRNELQSVDFLSGGQIENKAIVATNVRGVEGRNVVAKDLFYYMGGFDEDMIDWGYEDSNLSERMMALGYLGKVIGDKHLSCIDHDDGERTKFFRNGVTGRNTGRKFGSCKENYLRWLRKKSIGKIRLNQTDMGCGIVLTNFSDAPVILEELTLDELPIPRSNAKM